MPIQIIDTKPSFSSQMGAALGGGISAGITQGLEKRQKKAGDAERNRVIKEQLGIDIPLVLPTILYRLW